MRKHALIIGGEVVKVESLDEALYMVRLPDYDCIIDIEDQIPVPEVGWKLVGNKIEASNIDMSVDAAVLFQQSAQRVFGQKLAITLVDMMGARNLKLALQGTPADVNSLLSTLGTIKSLMDTGALKTARNLTMYVKAGFPLHLDILEYAIAEIDNFLTSNGF